MNENSKEVLNALAIPGNCVKDILKNNNTFFYQKGWDNGFLVGAGTAGLTIGIILFGGATAAVTYNVIKGVCNGSKSVQNKQ